MPVLPKKALLMRKLAFAHAKLSFYLSVLKNTKSCYATSFSKRSNAGRRLVFKPAAGLSMGSRPD